MRKDDELTNPQSCMMRAKRGEWTFVLLARDRTAPLVIWCWMILRILFRKNKWKDEQIQEAKSCAKQMRHSFKTELPYLKSKALYSVCSNCPTENECCMTGFCEIAEVKIARK